MKKYLAYISCLFLYSFTEITVEEGAAHMEQKGNRLTVTAKDKTILSSPHFSVPEGAVVDYILPSSQAALMHKVTGNDLSHIGGEIYCNGQYILVNPQGITIGPKGKIDVASLVLSTLYIPNQDFSSSSWNFSSSPTSGAIVNEGIIHVHPSGYLCLLANHIENKGTIQAVQTKVHLLSGDKITLDFQGDNLYSLL